MSLNSSVVVFAKWLVVPSWQSWMGGVAQCLLKCPVLISCLRISSVQFCWLSPTTELRRHVLPIRGERIVFWWPNTNTNIIWFSKNDQIQIRILFSFPKMTEYEYEYYLVSQKWPNTNIIRFPKNDRIRIRILFRYPEMTEYEYEYYSAYQ